MKSIRKWLGWVVTAVLLCSIVFLLFSGQSGDIVVGSKHFTEQKILGEIIAQLIEHQTDLKVQRRLGLQGTKVAFAAVREGNLDIYPEYTGTALVNILEETYDPNLGRQEIFAHVQDEFMQRWDLRFLEPLGFANTYAFAMRQQQANELGIERVSELEPYADQLQPGFDHEFTMRPEYKRFADLYGFGFEKDIIKLDPDLTYKALSSGSVDIIDAFSTDGRIEAYSIRVLEDDKNLFPPYDACIIVRNDILQVYPQLKKVLEQLSGLINARQMRKMNYAVTEDLRAPSWVARKFLLSQGLILQDVKVSQQ